MSSNIAMTPAIDCTISIGQLKLLNKCLGKTLAAVPFDFADDDLEEAELLYATINSVIEHVTANPDEKAIHGLCL